MFLFILIFSFNFFLSILTEKRRVLTLQRSMQMVDKGEVSNRGFLWKIINASFGIHLTWGMRIYELEFILSGTYEVSRWIIKVFWKGHVTPLVYEGVVPPPQSSTSTHFGYRGNMTISALIYDYSCSWFDKSDSRWCFINLFLCYWL